MSHYNLREHMTLYCMNGETVILEKFTDTHIWVKYKGKVYEREITTINNKLFYDDPCAKIIYLQNGKIYDSLEECKAEVRDDKAAPSVIIESNIMPKEGREEKKSCMNCRFQKSGECSSWEPCDEFQPVYKISQSDMSYWPKEGDATRFKRKGHKK